MASPNYGNKYDAIQSGDMEVRRDGYTNKNSYTNLIAALKKKDEQGNTLFHIAAKNGTATMIEDRLNALYRFTGPNHTYNLPADINSILSTKNCEGDTILHIAVKNGTEEIIKLILSFLKIKNIFVYDILSIENNLCRSPLDVAAYIGNENIIELLLREMDSNRYNDQLQTAKSWANISDNQDIVLLLSNQLEQIKNHYTCGMCDESFTTHTSLEEHEKKCIAGKPCESIVRRNQTGKECYHCRVCIHPFDSNYNLEAHYRTPNGVNLRNHLINRLF